MEHEMKFSQKRTESWVMWNDIIYMVSGQGTGQYSCLGGGGTGGVKWRVFPQRKVFLKMIL